jgi:hypothetical protein
MKLIKPDEITGKILSLLEESKEHVLIVSPYVNISKWYKLTKKLHSIRERGVHLEFIIRDDETNIKSFEELERLNIRFRAIPNLHCKLYLNERTAIFTSMNLLLSSEINSLELGYETETNDEYNELLNFANNYLNVDFSNNSYAHNKSLLDLLSDELSSKTEREIRIQDEDGAYKINTRTNNYDCFIWSTGKSNKLRISGVLSGREFEALSESDPITVSGLTIEYQSGEGKYYDMAWATGTHDLRSHNLNHVEEAEVELLLGNITEFITAIDEFKRTPHNKR